MCGIYGSVGFAPDRGRIDIVRHRGPDGSGWVEFESAAGRLVLGHRRLAIIDVSEGGHQPMHDGAERYHLTFNGEIYNYIELREELSAAGHVFTSNSDSEVLLASYIAWGDGCLHRFRGMFAFLIWDQREQVLFAARDRFGIKPLYYIHNRYGLAFGSEIKQLHGLPGLSARMNVARVQDFLLSGISNHTAETMFEGVNQLRGGECLHLDCKAAPLRPAVRRWYPAAASRVKITEREAGDRFRELLTDSVRLHLRSDVPLGSCLSGGLDSSSLVCLMSQMLRAEGKGASVNTISACYAEKSVDEKPFMERVIEQTGARPHYIYPQPEELLDKAAELTWHQDEPFGSTSIFAQWRVFEEARRNGITVMIDGQGADEQLAGYHASFIYYVNDLIKQRRLMMLARTGIERLWYHGLPLTSQLRTLAPRLLPPPLAALLASAGVSYPQRDWLNGEAVRSRGNPKTALRVAEELLGLPQVHDVASLCMTLTFGSNLAMLLHFEDRNSMAHSIEARVPFLDHPLVEFSLGLGNDHKIVGGDTKRVLRRAMAGVLPPTVLKRRDKLGFSTPEQIWFQGPMRGAIEAGVDRTLSRYPELFDVTAARAFCREILDGRRPFETTLWRIVNLGIWGARFGVGL